MAMAAVVAAGMLGGSAAVAGGTAPTGFGALAAKGDLIEVYRPLFQDGRLRVGSATGTVRRRARGRERGVAAFGVDHRTVDRHGTVRFDVRGTEVGGALAGACGYHREERRMTAGAIDVAAPSAPLVLRCDFTQGGQPAGVLKMAAVPQPGVATPVEMRRGEVRFGDTRLTLRSAHALGARGVRVATPVGYWIEAGGVPVGAIDTNGVTRARLVLPRDPAQRAAALAAGIALATFWDPGDTDD